MPHYQSLKGIFNMKSSTLQILNELQDRYPNLASLREDILNAYLIMEETFRAGGKLLLCGNGGSAADSEHVVGELLKSFKKCRSIKEEVYNSLSDFKENGELLKNTLEGSLRAISLTSHLSLSTAFANDREPSVVFAQQLYGLADKGDTLVAFSTSGNSKNCVLAAITAKVMGVNVVSLTGKNDSKLSELSAVCIKAPEVETYKIQELHLPIYHAICAMLEEEFFD